MLLSNLLSAFTGLYDLLLLAQSSLRIVMCNSPKNNNITWLPINIDCGVIVNKCYW